MLNILKQFIDNKCSLPIMNLVSIAENHAIASDLESTVIVKHDSKFKPGCYSLHSLELAERVAPEPKVSNEEYPWLDKILEEPRYNFNLLTFIETAAKLIDAASTDGTRFNLCSLHINPNDCKLVCTNGHIMHYAHYESFLTVPVIIPSAFIHKLIKCKKLLNGYDTKSCVIGIVDDRLIIEASNIKFIVSLIARQYPDYKQVIPKHKELTLSLHNPDKLYKDLVNMKLEKAKLHSGYKPPTYAIITNEGIDILDKRYGQEVRYKLAKHLSTVNIKDEIPLNAYYLMLALKNSKFNCYLDVIDHLNALLFHHEAHKSIVMPCRLN